ncbi:Opsin-5 [Penaeus vannamei]|uniref:Opsin-5 n=1 Tax=Penaeus vannamei TaxID=6689 RepID=A0A3R7PYR0_PENVA|nr:Opsin-5 [Penaeus vannamei]
MRSSPRANECRGSLDAWINASESHENYAKQVLPSKVNKHDNGNPKNMAQNLRSSHVCTLSLAVSDVAFSLLVHTLMILAALGVDSALLFNTIGCNYYGFCAMFFGTFSMCIHASVSLIRYINICHPEKVEWLQLKYVYILILGSGLYSVAWAVGPILQWGRYETFEFGCTLAFTDPSRSNRSYVTCAFFFVLLFPLGVVVTCYSLIVMQAHKYQREMSRIAHGGPNKTGDMATIINHVGSVRKTQRSLRLHNKLIRMSMVVAGGYVLGWLPYAAVCMWATYGDYQHIPIVSHLTPFSAQTHPLLPPCGLPRDTLRLPRCFRQSLSLSMPSARTRCR